MQKGSKHKPETIEKLRSVWAAAQSASVAEAPRPASDTRIDATACTRWLGALNDDEFYSFCINNIVKRFVRVRDDRKSLGTA